MARMRLVHITQSPPNPSHYTVLVRSIPRSAEGSLSDTVKSFFMKYHASSYLSHQMVYRVGKVQRIMVRDLFCRFSSLLSFTTSFYSWYLLMRAEI